MHIAAMKQNVSMMKLLIKHGFDCDKLINNIGSHKSVFLILCENGNAECMDYLMNIKQCKNKIDIFQRDANKFNGLHLAIKSQHLLMVDYLLNNVYKTHEMKSKIFGQSAGMNGIHISCLAAQQGGTAQDGLSIFKLLKKNRCPIHPGAIEYAASYSSLVLEYMLNEQLYPNFSYLTKGLIVNTVSNAEIDLVHKNILIIVKYLNNMEDNVSTNEYQHWILNIFSSIMMNGTMDGYFKMFKKIIEILLNNSDWKCIATNKIIDKKLLINVKEKMKNNNARNMQDIVDDKWGLLLQTMIDSFDDKTLLNKYDNGSDNESDVKSNDNDNDNDIAKLIDLLKNEEFGQFNQMIMKQENMISTVEC